MTEDTIIYMPGNVDLTSAKEVQVVIGGAGQLWVNVEGRCRLRAYRIERLVIDDQRQHGDSDLNCGDLVTSRDELRSLCKEFCNNHSVFARSYATELADFITTRLVHNARQR